MQPRLAPRVCRRVVSLAALYCSTARRGLRLRGPLGGETITVPGGLAHSNSILELPVSVPPAFTRWPRFLHILFGRGPSLRRLWGIYGPTEAHLMGGNPTAASGRMHNDSRRGRRANPYRWAGPAYLLSWGRPSALPQPDALSPRRSAPDICHIIPPETYYALPVPWPIGRLDAGFAADANFALTAF
jgi:hypothetical protein